MRDCDICGGEGLIYAVCRRCYGNGCRSCDMGEVIMPCTCEEGERLESEADERRLDAALSRQENRDAAERARWED